MRSPRCLLAVFCASFLFASPLVAEVVHSKLSGEVKDAKGLKLPGVSVEISGLNIHKTTTSDTQGNFIFLDLPAAEYHIALELSGFKGITQSIRVDSTEQHLSFTLSATELAETVVVTASKAETPLIQAPAAVTVLNSEKIENSSAENYADLLRSVPGINAMQASNRDVNLTSRFATGRLSGPLVLLDGRTTYLDVGGFVLWDLIPINKYEIRQIEVIRSPASALWGANAQAGVINIITKTPRETPGTLLTISAGTFDRKVESGSELDDGGSFETSLRYAASVNEKWSYKISGGFLHSEPFARPAGSIPFSHVPNTNVITGGIPYSLLDNTSLNTNQPKFDVRMDEDLNPDSKLTYSAGFGGTDGTLLARTGPFRIENGSKLGYGKVNYTSGSFKTSLFANILDAKTINLVGAIDSTGKPLPFTFKTQSYNVEAVDTKLIKNRNLLTYGANFRYSAFDINISPRANNRNEISAYGQDEFSLDKFRFSVGTRLDKFSTIDHPVFSPRLTVLFEPVSHHVFRASYDRAFHIPSVQDNDLDVTLLTAIQLPFFGLYRFPTRALGNPNLKESAVNAWEIGYTGDWNAKTTIGVSLYLNDTYDPFPLRPKVFYGPSTPPPGWPFPASFVPPNRLPALLESNNLEATIRNKGFEVSVDQAINSQWSAYANYSYQSEPDVISKKNPNELPDSNFPPRHRSNAGVQFSTARYLGSASVNHQSSAFWIDVLDARFWGPTDGFTMVNASFGIRWLNGRLLTSLKVNDLFNREIQQHILGDVIKRSIMLEAQLHF